jgi:hypothetical protein
MVRGALDQDDLYVEMTFTAVMDSIGLDATTEQYGDAFRDTKYHLWHANAGARRLLNNGIKAPMSGHPKYNVHANDIDFQIEADFIGLMTPGLPNETIKYCNRVGRVMNYGDGVYGGMFVCGMYSAAFFESDPKKLVEAGVACMPEGSVYRETIEDVIRFSEEYPDDWKKCWAATNEKWDKNDSCSEGSLAPFNIDASLNGAYIAIGMLYGDGDFDKTMEISTRCGQDSDCNPASAVGVLGVVMGYEALDEKWVGAIPDMENEKFNFTNYTFNEMVDSTMKRALTIIQESGGSVDGNTVTIRTQTPEPRLLNSGRWVCRSRRYSIRMMPWSGRAIGRTLLTLAMSVRQPSTARPVATLRHCRLKEPVFRLSEIFRKRAARQTCISTGRWRVQLIRIWKAALRIRICFMRTDLRTERMS